MAVTGIADITNLIPKVWSPKFYEELRQQTMLLNLFSREYEGEIKSRGDAVNVSQIGVPTAATLTDDKTAFVPASMANSTFQLVADKQTVAAFEFTDLAQLQSISFMEEAKKALVESLKIKIEQTLITAYNAAVAGFVIATPSDCSVADIVKARTNLSKLKVPMSDRYLILDPEYAGDLLSKNQIISSDFIANNVTQSGQVNPKIMGFNVMEHNGLGANSGMAFHKSAIQMVTQREVQLKISDLHSNNKLGYVMSADIIWGYKIFDATRAERLKNA